MPDRSTRVLEEITIGKVFAVEIRVKDYVVIEPGGHCYNHERFIGYHGGKRNGDGGYYSQLREVVFEGFRRLNKTPEVENRKSELNRRKWDVTTVREDAGESNDITHYSQYKASRYGRGYPT